MRFEKPTLKENKMETILLTLAKYNNEIYTVCGYYSVLVLSVEQGRC